MYTFLLIISRDGVAVSTASTTIELQAAQPPIVTLTVPTGVVTSRAFSRIVVVATNIQLPAETTAEQSRSTQIAWSVVEPAGLSVGTLSTSSQTLLIDRATLMTDALNTADRVVVRCTVSLTFGEQIVSGFADATVQLQSLPVPGLLSTPAFAEEMERVIVSTTPWSYAGSNLQLSVFATSTEGNNPAQRLGNFPQGALSLTARLPAGNWRAFAVGCDEYGGCAESAPVLVNVSRLTLADAATSFDAATRGSQDAADVAQAVTAYGTSVQRISDASAAENARAAMVEALAAVVSADADFIKSLSGQTAVLTSLRVIAADTAILPSTSVTALNVLSNTLKETLNGEGFSDQLKQQIETCLDVIETILQSLRPNDASPGASSLMALRARLSTLAESTATQVFESALDAVLVSLNAASQRVLTVGNQLELTSSSSASVLSRFSLPTTDVQTAAVATGGVSAALQPLSGISTVDLRLTVLPSTSASTADYMAYVDIVDSGLTAVPGALFELSFALDCPTDHTCDATCLVYSTSAHVWTTHSEATVENGRIRCTGEGSATYSYRSEATKNPGSESGSSISLPIIAGAAAGGAILLVLACLGFRLRRTRKTQPERAEPWTAPQLSSHQQSPFNYDDLPPYNVNV